MKKEESVVKEEEVFQWLKDLPTKDLSEARTKEDVEVSGAYSVVDCWKARMNALLINTPFVAYLDLSWARIDEVVLVGQFVRVDLTNAVIGALWINDERTEIIGLDKTGAKISEIKEKKKNKG
ncbi:MAG: hypothetical protein HY443_00060 [Candidatus Nealsonbacteria bacterium]|nr:hypothetical protein [Candidatus Nealsonbacteria bacterium]